MKGLRIGKFMKKKRIYKKLSSEANVLRAGGEVQEVIHVLRRVLFFSFGVGLRVRGYEAVFFLCFFGQDDNFVFCCYFNWIS